ncbi:MAG: hypothetical protein IKE38_01440, partial [Erysipelotrichaceae bacterium]|nr:hypothetical protein [Erysipelotrichaceae bacterium]
IDMMSPYASGFICITPDSHRALKALELASCIRNKGLKANTAPDVETGIKMALIEAGDDGAIIAFGSLYLAGDIKNSFLKAYEGYKNNRV